MNDWFDKAVIAILIFVAIGLFWAMFMLSAVTFDYLGWI